MTKSLLTLTPILAASLFVSVSAHAANSESSPAATQAAAGWTTFVRGGGILQSKADLDNGGSYDSSRYNIQVGRGYSWSRRTAVSLSFSYSNDDYSFDGEDPGTIAAMAPWETVHTYSLSAPARIPVSDSWSAFLIPTIRSTGESGADFDDTITGGAITGLSYRFGDNLTIGPGLGVYSQLEDSTSFFPFIIIDWKITDRISLETGRGLAATQGPGLTLTYRANQQWTFGLGGRYEKLRFRLDSDGEKGGIGEETSVPLFLSASYNFNRKARLSLIGGTEIESELTVEDSSGNTLAEESADPSFFGGVTFNLRL